MSSPGQWRRQRIVALGLLLIALALAPAMALLQTAGAQTVGPQGDEFDSSTFVAPFHLQCGVNAASCPDAQGPKGTNTQDTWSLNGDNSPILPSTGVLRIWTQAGSLEANENNARNIVLQHVTPDANYTVTTSVAFPSLAQSAGTQFLGQTAGLIVYQNDDNFLYIARQLCNSDTGFTAFPANTPPLACTGGGGSRITVVQEVNGVPYDHATVVETGGEPLGPVYLRIFKTSTFYQASYSYDNVNFLPLGPASGAPTPSPAPTSTSTATPVATATGTPAATIAPTSTATPVPSSADVYYSSPSVGVFAWGGPNPASQSNLFAADFDWFRTGNSQVPAATATATSTATATATTPPTATATTPPTATATTPPTATATRTPTATVTAVATLPIVPTATPQPIATSTPFPTATSIPPKKKFTFAIKSYTVKHGIIHVGQVQTISITAKTKTAYGIWAHVVFPSGRSLNWYTLTNRKGTWKKSFTIARQALGSYSHITYVMLRLWHGKKHLDAWTYFLVRA